MIFFFNEIYQRYTASVTESLRLVDERDESVLLGARGCNFILSPLRCSSRLSLAVLTTAWPVLSHTSVTWSARYASAVINLNQVCSRGRTPKTLSKVPGLKTLLGLAFLLRAVFLRPKWARHNTFYCFCCFFYLFTLSLTTAVGEGRKKIETWDPFQSCQFFCNSCQPQNCILFYKSCLKFLAGNHPAFHAAGHNTMNYLTRDVNFFFYMPHRQIKSPLFRCKRTRLFCVSIDCAASWARRGHSCCSSIVPPRGARCMFLTFFHRRVWPEVYCSCYVP